MTTSGMQPKLFLLSLALIVATVAGCSRSAPSGRGQPGTANPAVAPGAQVIFAAGDVRGRQHGAWTPIDIGAKLLQGDALRVGAGSECQIQVGNIAVVSIRENSEIELDTVLQADSGSKAKLGLTVGTVLAKVRKLGAQEGFSVRSATTVAGVRGTAFSVSQLRTGGTVVAVREGTVAVLPAAFDTDALEALAPTTIPEIQRLAEQIQAAAATVSAGNEMTVTPADAARAATQFTAIRTAADQIVQEHASGQAPSSSEAAARSDSVRTAVGGLAASTGASSSLSPVQTRLLQGLDKLPLPSAAPPAGSSSAPTTPALAASARASVSIEVTPSDAEIVRDGSTVGTGRYQADIPDGASFTVLVRREGYAEKTLQAVAAAGKLVNLSVQLEPEPIEGRFRVSKASIIGAVGTAGDALVTADAAGQIAAHDLGGRLLWSASTRNAPNENSFPVMSAGTIAFSGAQEFLLLDAANGHEILRVPSDSASAHVFGQRVYLSDSLGIYPTASSLRIFDPKTGKTTKEVPIPGGTLMSPAASGDRIFVVSQSGEFLALNARTGDIAARIPTPASQPVATSVLVQLPRAFFADRKGNLFAIDLDAGRVLWQAALPGKGSAGVFQDLAGSEDGVYAYARNMISAYSPQDGKPLFPPIADAAAPPLVSGGRLYFGTAQGQLVVADARSGARLAELSLGAVANTRPTPDGPRLLVGTTAGEVVVIYPGTIK